MVQNIPAVCYCKCQTSSLISTGPFLLPPSCPLQIFFTLKPLSSTLKRLLTVTPQLMSGFTLIHLNKPRCQTSCSCLPYSGTIHPSHQEDSASVRAAQSPELLGQGLPPLQNFPHLPLNSKVLIISLLFLNTQTSYCNSSFLVSASCLVRWMECFKNENSWHLSVALHHT